MKEEGRELIYKGALNRRGTGQGDSGELQVFLFDHALLMVKQKSKGDQYKVYRRVRSLHFSLRLQYHSISEYRGISLCSQYH